MTIQEIEALGYTYRKNVVDAMGIKHPIGIYPASKSGGINYFNSLTDLRNWMRDVRLVRAMQNGDDITYERLKMAQMVKGKLLPTWMTI